MKIAILMPRCPDFHWVWRVRSLITVLSLAIEKSQINASIVLGLHREPGNVANKLCFEKDILPLPGKVSIRYYHWEEVDSISASRMFPLVDFDYLGVDKVNIPRDWGWNFRDCSNWIICADRSSGAILPIVKTHIFAPDLAERYMVFSDLSDPSSRIQRLVSWRRCHGFISSNIATIDDYVAYIGGFRSRASILSPLIPDRGKDLRITEGRKRDIFVLMRGDNVDEIQLLTETLSILSIVRPQLSVRIAVDCTSLSSDEESRRVESVVRALKNVESDIDDAACLDVLVVPQRSYIGWFKAITRTKLVLSLENHPGEPKNYLSVVGLELIYVGLKTYESERLSKFLGGACLYETSNAQDIVVALLKAIEVSETNTRTDLNFNEIWINKNVEDWQLMLTQLKEQ